MATQNHHKIAWIFTVLGFRIRSKPGIKIYYYVISKHTGFQRKVSKNNKLCTGLALLKYLLNPEVNIETY